MYIFPDFLLSVVKGCIYNLLHCCETRKLTFFFPGNINYKIFHGNQMDKSQIFLRCKRLLRFDSLVFQSCSQ